MSMCNFFTRMGAFAILVASIAGCSRPNTSPDQTIGGTVLGAGWGAGAGAVVGNQISVGAGEAVGVGAGFGAVSGAMIGYGNDRTEDSQANLEKQLASLKLQNLNNEQQMQGLQYDLDNAQPSGSLGGVHQVYFDDDATSLRSGAIANLEIVAESIRTSPAAIKIRVNGHADDAGSPDYNLRLSEARARTVASYLGARGISMDQIIVEGFGSTRPLATNTTPEGRQLNRRVDVFIGR